MPKKLPTLRSVAGLLLVLLLLLLLFTHTDIAADGVRRGLTLCLETLFPSLFPFLVLSELLISQRAGEVLGRLLAHPARFLLGLSGGGAAALLLGMLCGFPVGTTAAMGMYERGEISREELQRLFLFVNNPSPGFLIGAVGGRMLGSVGIGAVLWGLVWGTALLIGIFLRVLYGATPQIANIPLNGARNTPSVSQLTASVTKGFFTLLQVFAFVLFFSCVTACLSPATATLPTAVGAAVTGLLEMTSGIGCAVSSLSARDAFRFIAFFSGFAGLSVCLQLFSVAENAHLRPLPYLLAKLVQGALCLLCAEIYLHLFGPPPAPVQCVVTFAQNRVQQHVLLVGLLLGFLCLVLAVWQQRKKAHSL